MKSPALRDVVLQTLVGCQLIQDLQALLRGASGSADGLEQLAAGRTCERGIDASPDRGILRSRETRAAAA